MESAIVLAIGLALYAFVYRYYTKWFDRRVIESDPKRVTPAHTYMDGVEFFPTNRYVLFGFHAKTVAGLGPIVGPIIATQWGWLPALLWILFGNTFIGWLHDYSSLMISVRSEGASFGPISYRLISPRARALLLTFVVFYLYLLLAGFIPILVGIMPAAAGEVVTGFPAAPIPILVTIIAGLVGAYMVYKLKIHIAVSTIVALVIAAIGVGLGVLYPVTVPAAIATDFWFFWLLLFCFLGAVLPIWVFLQPINYLAFYLVYFVVFASIIGAFIGAPRFYQPAFTTFMTPPPGAGPLWPLLFVVLACGAISGWHSLVGSSASSKQLDNEVDATLVGGGGMFFEGILALTSLVMVAILTVSDAWTLKAGAFIRGAEILLGHVGFPPGVAVATASAALVICGVTMANLVLRVIRLFQGEIAGPRFAGIFKNPYISALIACLVVYFIGRTGTWVYIWVLFGSSNQLLASLALLLVTIWLLREKKPAYFTGIPMAFVMATTLGALCIVSWKTLGVAGEAIAAGEIAKAAGNAAAGIIGILLLILALVLIYEGGKAYSKIKAEIAKA